MPSPMVSEAAPKLHSQQIVACIWDFDKTLIPGYMQTPLFKHFQVDEKRFWNEVNALPGLYAKRGQKVHRDTIYLNHLLTYVKNGPMKGLSNALMRKLGAELKFYPGLPAFFEELRNIPLSRPEYVRHGLKLEHYVVSTGLAEMIHGSAIAPFVENIFGCELIENPLPPFFSSQPELAVESNPEVAQVGIAIDNTSKTRCVFEINKGTNKNPDVDVNAKVLADDRRVPFKNMIYIADGPSDVPVFSVVRKGGGKAFAVYDPSNPAEFRQNDLMLQTGRIHAYGPANYTPASSTHMWMRMHVQEICERVVREGELYLARRVSGPPRHLHKDEPVVPSAPRQDSLFGE